MLKELMNRPFVGELLAGEHKVALQSWEYRANDDPSKDYIKITLNVENNGKKQIYNRNQFERDMAIMLSHVRRQIGKASDVIDPKAFLDDLVENQTEFKMWVAYEIVPTKASGLRRVQNIYFQPPINSTSTKSADDMEIPLA